MKTKNTNKPFENQPAKSGLINRIVMSLPDKKMIWESEYKFNRRMAKKYKLDFEHRCCFHHQIYHISKDIKDNWLDQEITVRMLSGKLARYLLTKHNDMYGGTGQKIWRFKFLNYIP